MTFQRLSLGKQGEELARHLLQRKRHKILATNLKNKLGEIDILTEQRGTIVLVEVKTKYGLDFGLPQDMITRAKQRKLRLLARWLEQEYPNRPIRIDVIGIDMAPDPPTIEHLENALGAG